MSAQDEDTAPHIVLINAEEQYSLWPKGLTVPSGWSEVGFEGTRHECRAFVDVNWTDLRPKSLRERSAIPQSSPGEG